MKTGLTVTIAATSGILIALLASTVRSDDTAAVRPAYVGAEKCKMCHMAQYKTWQATSMSTAYERIKDAPDKELCLSCHTTGYGQPGGFVAGDTSPRLQGVQCESCHGPGGAHVALPISNRDTETRRGTINRFITDCRSCHNPHVPDKAAAARARAAAAR